MALPDAAKCWVLRKPRVRSECTTLRVATIKERAVTALDRRVSGPLTSGLLSRLLSSIFGRCPSLSPEVAVNP
jgi:hypothetical protein